MRIIATTTTWHKTKIEHIEAWTSYYMRQKIETYATCEANMNPTELARFHNTRIHGLLKEYDWVVVSDPDEIVVPNPFLYKDIADYIDHISDPIVSSTGYELLNGVLTRNNIYDKVCLFSESPKLVRSTHNNDLKPPLIPDPQLFLLHMKYL